MNRRFEYCEKQSSPCNKTFIFIFNFDVFDVNK